MPLKTPNPTPEMAVSLWPSKDPHSASNKDELHRINLIDYGFNHLDIPVPNPVSFADLPTLPEAQTFKDPAKEAAYLQLIANKLSLTKDFILKENELGLDSNRRVDKDPTAVLLAKGSITFSFYTQEVIRDLVNFRIKIFDLGQNDEYENEEALQKLGHEFFWAWRELKGLLLNLVPKTRDEVRDKWVEIIMVEVLGENLVEAGTEEEPMDVDGEEREKAFV
jgi:hypothetical protein